MDIHHIGYLVREIPEAEKEFFRLGFKADGGITLDEARNIFIEFLKNGEYTIELVAPANEKAPVHRLMKKCGSMPYHICYLSQNLYEDVEQLKKDGYIVIEEPLTAPAIKNRRVAFLFKETVGIIELVEK
ncbi:MAG TPA: lactoylglutathione lyase [Ruminococcaceae bacterium]|nr:lactoylglutathione lyase [Oscillospiraceae bacterium]